MAADLLLEVEGLKGEARDPEIPDAMALTSWALGVDREVGAAGGGDRSLSDPRVTELHLTARIDQMSSGIAALCASGKAPAKRVVLTQRRQGGGKIGETVVRITMRNVIFSQIRYTATADDLPSVAMALSFTEIDFDYFPQSSDSGQKQAVFSWNWYGLSGR